MDHVYSCQLPTPAVLIVSLLPLLSLVVSLQCLLSLALFVSFLPLPLLALVVSLLPLLSQIFPISPAVTFFSWLSPPGGFWYENLKLLLELPL